MLCWVCRLSDGALLGGDDAKDVIVSAVDVVVVKVKPGEEGGTPGDEPGSGGLLYDDSGLACELSDGVVGGGNAVNSPERRPPPAAAEAEAELNGCC